MRHNSFMFPTILRAKCGDQDTQFLGKNDMSCPRSSHSCVLSLSLSAVHKEFDFMRLNFMLAGCPVCIAILMIQTALEGFSHTVHHKYSHIICHTLSTFCNVLHAGMVLPLCRDSGGQGNGWQYPRWRGAVKHSGGNLRFHDVLSRFWTYFHHLRILGLNKLYHLRREGWRVCNSYLELGWNSWNIETYRNYLNLSDCWNCLPGTPRSPGAWASFGRSGPLKIPSSSWGTRGKLWGGDGETGDGSENSGGWSAFRCSLDIYRLFIVSMKILAVDYHPCIPEASWSTGTGRKWVW